MCLAWLFLLFGSLRLKRDNLCTQARFFTMEVADRGSYTVTQLVETTACESTKGHGGRPLYLQYSLENLPPIVPLASCCLECGLSRGVSSIKKC